MTIEGKIDMIVRGFGAEGIFNLFLPVLKMKNYLRRDILAFIFFTKKKELNFRYRWIKGYRYDETTVDQDSIKNFNEIYSFQNTDVSEVKLNYYFNKFIELCRKNAIELICVRSAYPPSRLKLNTEDDVRDYFHQACSDKNIPFIDFNYIASEKYKYLDSDFSDYHHMNFRGAQKITKHLSEILKKRINGEF